MEFSFRHNEMKGCIAGAGDSPVNRSLTIMIYKSLEIGPMISHTCLPEGCRRSIVQPYINFFIFRQEKMKVFCYVVDIMKYFFELAEL